jgi:Zn-dependent protease with chaperone function
MAMLVPAIEGIVQGFRQLIQVVKSSSLQRQRAQLLPARLNQVQPTSLLKGIFLWWNRACEYSADRAGLLA